MGHVRVIGVAHETRSANRLMGAVARGADLVAGSALLLIALPLMAMLALAVRRSSHGPVLHREPGFDGRGRPVELLSFRTRMDGAGTVAHERLRAAVGNGRADALTGAGRIMEATHTDRLPRLINVVAGHAGFFRR